MRLLVPLRRTRTRLIRRWVRKAEPEVRVIEAKQPGIGEALREAWRYRYLVGYFGGRFLEKRYMRSWLGRAWIPLRPLMDVASRSFLFGGVLNVPSRGVPYMLFFVVGQSVWDLFQTTLQWTIKSLELNRLVLRRIYVPRLTIVAGAIVPSLVNFAIYLTIASGIIAFHVVADGRLFIEIGLQTLVAGAGVILILAFALALGLWLSILGAQARDLRYSFGYTITFWSYLTPVIYPLSSLPEQVRPLAALNPMTAPIEMVKYGLIGAGTVTQAAVVTTLAALLLVGGLGLVFFVRSEAASV